MTADKHDSDDEREETAERKESTLGRYRNGGREATDARRQPRGRPVGRSNESGPGVERPPVGHRYGSDGRPPSDRSERRYGSQPPTGSPGTAAPRDEGREGEAGGPVSEHRAPEEPPREQEPKRGQEPTDGRAPPDAEREGVSDRPENSGRREGPESGRRRADEPRVERPANETPPKRTQPLREPSEPLESGGPSGSGSPDDADEHPPRYGGPRDDEGRRRASERERTQREYERRMDRKWDRQRDLKRDKSGRGFRRGR